MLSRKDYIGLCNALATGVASGSVMSAIHEWLGKDNPRFNKEKFDAYLTKLIEEKKHAPIA